MLKTSDKIIEEVTASFKNRFLDDPLVLYSPGRINLIGEHTDYNQGFVLPAAIDKVILIAIAPSATNSSCFVSLDFDDTYTGSTQQITGRKGDWSDYINGVVLELQHNGLTIPEFNCVIAGDIPFGAGMSSSAALECALIYGLNQIFELGLDKLKMVKIAQRAENNFVGVKCGIMDQFASMFGKKNHLIKLDCRSLEYDYIPFELKDITVLLLDTGVKHSLASSEYNNRREQCETGVSIIQQHHKNVQSLRDVSVEMVEAFLDHGSVIYKRCLYVVAENQRLVEGCNDLVNGDLNAFGQKMFATHDGLRYLYEVSCAEADFLVDYAKQHEGVLGARIMGGGFGGCTINLINRDRADNFIDSVSTLYGSAFGSKLKPYKVEIIDGTYNVLK
jgi:galactokinase